MGIVGPSVDGRYRIDHQNKTILGSLSQDGKGVVDAITESELRAVDTGAVCPDYESWSEELKTLGVAAKS